MKQFALLCAAIGLALIEIVGSTALVNLPSPVLAEPVVLPPTIVRPCADERKEC